MWSQRLHPRRLRLGLLDHRGARDRRRPPVRADAVEGSGRARRRQRRRAVAPHHAARARSTSRTTARPSPASRPARWSPATSSGCRAPTVAWSPSRAGDGRELWSTELGAPIVSAPAPAGDRLVVATFDGTIRALAPAPAALPGAVEPCPTDGEPPPPPPGEAGCCGTSRDARGTVALAALLALAPPRPRRRRRGAWRVVGSNRERPRRPDRAGPAAGGRGRHAHRGAATLARGRPGDPRARRSTRRRARVGRERDLPPAQAPPSFAHRTTPSGTRPWPTPTPTY